jgi:putative hydrolase of the HAD superfamily
VSDVDHARGAALVEVRQPFRHGDQDMRMPDTRAVLFDYGRTLVTFEYPTDELLEVMRRFRPRIEAALGSPAPEAEAILESVLLPLEQFVGSISEDEVDYVGVYRETWAKAGMNLPAGLLHEILDAEQMCWDGAARLDPDAQPILSWLGVHGIKRAVCSNAPFPPEMMRRQVETNGVADLVDAVVFSSETRKRKPAAEIYLAALESIGVEPQHALFVGDRVREDYEGPRALGMRAVIFTAHAEALPPNGIPTISSLSELANLV